MRRLLLAAFEQTAENAVWRQAAKHLDGGGAEEGVWWQHVPALAERLEKESQHSLASLVRLVACGGYWTEERRFQAGYRTDDLCQRCHRSRESSRHRFWECMCNSMERDWARSVACLCLDRVRLALQALWPTGQDEPAADAAPALRVCVRLPRSYSGLPPIDEQLFRALGMPDPPVRLPPGSGIAGHVPHGSHLLWRKGALSFCSLCGRYADSRPARLLEECEATRHGPLALTKAQLTALLRLRKGLPPRGTYFEARCAPLESLIEEGLPGALAGAPAAVSGPLVVDLLSVDAEGAEVEIFRNFPFDRLQVRAIVVETSRRTSMAVDGLLLPMGFLKVAVLGKDAVYVHHRWISEMPSGGPLLPARIQWSEPGSDADSTDYLRFQRLFGVDGDLDEEVGDGRLQNETELALVQERQEAISVGGPWASTPAPRFRGPNKKVST
ncbi:unnamed protein product [Prorocentrum cordatum]|uniref:Methyltransferase FkbM domain-containing protein n=1 Tax=Prorocentrum cordatum TaxID=2364126 RepID=A0ABN9PXG4_9DINO|nr:unnamed protein product [Polarella glacialis]